MDEIHTVANAIEMRLPDIVLNSVGFFALDKPKAKYAGTGFIVAMGDDQKGYLLYVVTAAHVAEQLEKEPWLFGMNDKQGGKITLKDGGKAKWFYHPTEKANVDCAVTPFAPGMLQEYAVQPLPQAMFATEARIKKSNIGIGDDIHIVGLFTKFHGTVRHNPIVRSGCLAMMPTEPIPTEKYGLMESYLVEGRSIGGLSGSPVFVRETVHVQMFSADGTAHLSGHGAFYLLGLMHGHWKVDVATTEQVEAVNMGISQVLPAKKILEVLEQPALKELEKEVDGRGTRRI